MTTLAAEILSTAYPLFLRVSQDALPSPSPVTGLAPVVALRELAPGTPRYLDFSSGTFKASGWTTRTLAMVEQSPGCYLATVDLAACPGLAVGLVLVAEYAAGTFAATDTIAIVDTETARAILDVLRKQTTNRLEEVNGNPGTMILYDDDSATPLLTWRLADENGNAVLPTIGVPARRSKAT